MNGRYIVDVVDGRVVGDGTLLSEYMSQYANTAVDWTFADYTVAILLAFFLLGVSFSVFFIVRQQTLAIIERFGKFSRVATPGLRMKIPFVEKIVAEMSLRIEEIAEEVTVKSSDNVFVSVPVKIQFQVVEASAKEAFYQLDKARKQMSSYIVNVVRSTASDMDMEQIFKSKDMFEDAVNKTLNERFGGFGYSIRNVLVDNPIPSETVVRAFDSVIASKRLKEAAVNEAEAIRVKTVAKAQAEAESLTLKAEAYVTQRTTIAKGMKGIIGDDALASYLVGIDWRDTVRDASERGAMIIVPAGAETMGTLVGTLKTLSK